MPRQLAETNWPQRPGSTFIPPLRPPCLQADLREQQGLAFSLLGLADQLAVYAPALLWASPLLAPLLQASPLPGLWRRTGMAMLLFWACCSSTGQLLLLAL